MNRCALAALGVFLNAVCGLVPCRGQQPLISEFMAINTNTLQDEDGDYSDWIEIYNPASSNLDLTGWHLTDDAGNLNRWQFPALTLTSGGFVVVFASNKDRAVAGQELHTNFKLDGAGEYLALVRPDGSTVVSQYTPSYPLQVANVSYGVPPGSVTNVVVGTNAACRYLVPANGDLEEAWTAVFDDSGWSNGTFGLGYGNNYTSAIATRVESVMSNVNASLYVRVPFVLSQPAAIQSLSLSARYDDGFVAFINGQEVVSAQAPDPLLWNVVATNLHDGNLTETFPIADPEDVLVLGTNVLALQLLNRTANSSDLLLVPRLTLVTSVAPTSGLGFAYFLPATPGASNNFGAAVLGPALPSATATWPGLATGSTVTLTARAAATFYPVSNVTARYRVMFGAESNLVLHDDGLNGDAAAGDSIYSVQFTPSGLQTGQMLRWRYEATDTHTNLTKVPAFADPVDSPEYFGAVAAVPGLTSSLPILHYFVSNAAAAETRSGTRCSVAFLEEFYDNIRVDLHGQSTAGGAFPKKSHNFDFNAGERFRYQTDAARVKDIEILSNWADKSKLRNTLAWGTWTNTGHPAHFSFPIRVQRNGTFFSTYDLVEDPDELFLERTGLDPGGALYKIYNSLNSSTTNLEKKTRKFEGNSDLQGLIDGLNPSSPGRRNQFFDSVDVPSVVNFMAVNAVINNTDHGHKNYYVYRDSEGNGEWSLLPWDQDLSFGHVWTTSSNYFDDRIFFTNTVVYGTANRLYQLAYNLNGVTPDVRRMVMRRIRTLAEHWLGPTNTPPGQSYYEQEAARLLQRIDPDPGVSDADLDYSAWGSWGNTDNMAQAVARITNVYLPGRRTYLLTTLNTNFGGEIPGSQPTSALFGVRALDITPSSGNQDEEYIELVNSNAFDLDVSDWSLDGAVDFRFQPGTVLAAGSNLFLSPKVTAFRARASSPHSNESRFVQGNYGGHLSAWGETIEVYNATGLLLGAFGFTGTPSALQQNLRIGEIMFHPEDASNTNFLTGDFEYLELVNRGTGALDLAGARFTQGLTFTFTNGSLAAGARGLLVRNPAAFASRYDTNGLAVLGSFTNQLDDNGEGIKVEDASGETVLEFSYADGWAETADGEGYSLVYRATNTAPEAWTVAGNWGPSALLGGTPGHADPALDQVVINEFLPHSDVGADWIELRNASTGTVDLGGWLLSDSATALRKFQMPAGTLLTAGAYRVFTEGDFNNPTNPPCIVPFALSELGEEVHLTAASNGVPLDYHAAVRFEASDQEITFGRVARCDGGAVYPSMRSPTPGASNSAPRVGPIVFTEIMYHPASGQYEYIEIHNTTNTGVFLYDTNHVTNTWKVTGAIDFVFPTNTVLFADRYALLVPITPTVFRSLYFVPPLAQVFGPYGGSLANAGGRLRLRKPGIPETNGLVPYVVMEEVRYDDKAPWAAAADGAGPPLERVNEAAQANDPCAWRAANPLGSPGTATQLDDDGDLLPDSWEILQFGSTGVTVGAADRDADGALNWDEYLAGTSATNPASRFALTVSQPSNFAVVQFQTVAPTGIGYLGLQRFYDLETAPRAGQDAAWVGVPPFTNLAAVNGAVTFTNQNPASESYFRARVILQNAAP